MKVENLEHDNREKEHLKINKKRYNKSKRKKKELLLANWNKFGKRFLVLFRKTFLWEK